MKKQLLTLSFAFLGAGLIMALPPYTATSTDSARNHATISHWTGAPVIDGKGNDKIWTKVTAINIDRAFGKDSASYYSATWKAFWNDTSIFVLVELEDNNFWPSWKSKQPDWASDKVEVYFNANGKNPDKPGASTAGKKGMYQISVNWDTIEAMGKPHKGNFDSTWYADTWSYGDHSKLTFEWSIRFAKLRDSINALTSGSGLDPLSTTKIGFDVVAIDLDSGTGKPRQRQTWSGKGKPSENWGRMDSVGILTFSTTELDTNVIAIRQITRDDKALVYPTVVSDVLNVNGEQISVYNALGQLVKTVKDINNNQVYVGDLSKGVYVAVVKSNNQTRSEKFIVK
jgi:hypothetical protein